jgi:hypothetical protein
MRHQYTSPRIIATPNVAPKIAPRIVFVLLPDLPLAAVTGGEVVVSVGATATVGTAVAEALVDIVEPVGVRDAEEEEDVDVASAENTCCSSNMAVAFCQPFFFALKMHRTSSLFPPAITTISSWS